MSIANKNTTSKSTYDKREVSHTILQSPTTPAPESLPPIYWGGEKLKMRGVRVTEQG